MPRQGLRGSDVTLQARFYENGTLFDPFYVDTSVKIYDAPSGGTLVTTLTATKVSTGVWQVVWSIPSSQSTGSYYDEWTFEAVDGMGNYVQRNEFTVGSNFVLHPVQNTLTFENRLQTIEAAVNQLATALNNVPTKKQLNAISVLLQKLITEVSQELDTHKTVGHS